MKISGLPLDRRPSSVAIHSKSPAGRFAIALLALALVGKLTAASWIAGSFGAPLPPAVSPPWNLVQSTNIFAVTLVTNFTIPSPGQLLRVQTANNERVYYERTGTEVNIGLDLEFTAEVRVDPSTALTPFPGLQLMNRASAVASFGFARADGLGQVVSLIPGRVFMASSAAGNAGVGVAIDTTVLRTYTLRIERETAPSTRLVAVLTINGAPALRAPLVALPLRSFIGWGAFGDRRGMSEWRTVADNAAPLFNRNFNFSGNLLRNGRPPGGMQEMAFSFYNAPANGTRIAEDIRREVQTATGAFNVPLNLGDMFTSGQDVWMGVAVRSASEPNAPFTPLSDRIPIQPVPAAAYADVARRVLSGSIGAEALDIEAAVLKLNGIAGEVELVAGAGVAVAADPESRQITVSLAPSAGAGLNGIPWSSIPGLLPVDRLPMIPRSLLPPDLGGGGGGTPLPNGNFLGANNDNQFGGSASFSVIGGGQFTKISDENSHSTLGGGQLNRIYERSSWSFLGGGYNHQVGPDAAYASLGGGYSHILTNANSATIAGGSQNVAGGDYATVGGGSSNFAGPSGTVAGGGGNRAEGAGDTVGGGFGNLARAAQATVGGGNSNVVETSPYGTVAGGAGNRLTNSIGGSIVGGEQNGILDARDSAIGGGLNNVAGSPVSSIIGGEGNRTEGVGGYVTVLGGSHNLASATHSLAAGYRAHATHNGSFVWNAWQSDVFASQRDGEFAVHAPGGVRLQTDGGGLFVDGQRVSGGGGGGLLDGSVATATLADAAVTLPKLAISGTPGEGKLLSYSGGALSWAPAPGGNTGVTGGWALGGNAGTDPDINFLGTTDDRPLVIRVENEPALRMEWATNRVDLGAGVASEIVALNVTLGRGIIRPGVVGAIVGGIRHRSNADTLGPNAVYGNDSIALGGASNIAGKPDGDLLFSNGGAFVGGGYFNVAYGQNSVVVGGNANAASGFLGSVVGGRGNEANGSGDFVGGGLYNKAHGGDSSRFLAGYSAIAGGRQNIITNAISAFIGGGRSNRIGELADFAVIGGGLQNEAAGAGSMIVGGISNLAAGTRSFAAGTEARANHTGSFVWNDGSTGGFGSSQDNEFAVHAAGGARFDTGGAGVRADKLSITGNGTIESITGGNQTQPQLHLGQTVPGEYVRVFANTPQSFWSFGAGGANGWFSFYVPGQSPANTVDTGADRFIITPNGEVGVGSDRPFAQFHVRGRGGFDLPQIRATQLNPQEFARLRLETGQQSWDMSAGPDGSLRFFSGGTDRVVVSANGTLSATAINQTSDRNAKQDFKPVDARSVLAKVAALPISEWQFKTDGEGSRHVGPMAQDFREAFGLGTDERHIATVDADGVALAAIQGLNEVLEEQRATLARKDTELRELRDSVAELKAIVGRLVNEKGAR